MTVFTPLATYRHSKRQGIESHLLQTTRLGSVYSKRLHLPPPVLKRFHASESLANACQPIDLRQNSSGVASPTFFTSKMFCAVGALLAQCEVRRVTSELATRKAGIPEPARADHQLRKMGARKPMTRNRVIPKIILDLPGFTLENLSRDERWRDFSHFVHNAPGLSATAIAYEAEQQGELDGEHADYFAMLADEIVRLMKSAFAGDELSAMQVAAIHKMAFPKTYDLQRAHIEKVARFDRTASGKDVPSLARGYAVRWWMSRLSAVVAPKREGERLSPKSFIRILSEAECPGAHIPRLLKDINRFRSLAIRNRHARMTLQSLAIKVYLVDVGRLKIDAKQLEKDLRITRKYDTKYDQDDPLWMLLPVIGGDPLPMQIVSHKWRERRSLDG